MATNINGLIYYKLDANAHGYTGDITKNCGLRGEEIDGNFNFLRGNDIKSISFDENGTVYLTKYNGEILTAKQTDTPEYDFNYNPDSGVLTIVTPDGKEIALNGFKVQTTVYHDDAFDGYGSQEYPLHLSNIAKTGRYLPAIRLIDTTIKNEPRGRVESLPTSNIAKHDRYVTKEKISRFGRLFPLSGVEKISERLQTISSEWHIPSKAEWDEMLNAIDCAKPNHSSTDSNVELGEFAGTVLKATKYWKPSDDGKVYAEDAYGFTVYPVGYCGNRGKDYYGSFGLSAAFWTSTVEDNHKDMFVKSFEHDAETVGQHTWGDNYYLSLRLVKKFTGDNFNSAEDIDGFTCNCVHIPGTSLIWTKENIAFSQEQYDGFVPNKWLEYENDYTNENSYDIRYFVNDWNGNGWDKHEIKEGEGIVLYEGDNGRMHEWLLVDGELIDTALLIKSESQEELDKISERIEEEITDRLQAETQLWDAINNESSRAQEVEAQLLESINNEITRAQEVDNALLDAINAEVNRAQGAEQELWDAIKNETANKQEIAENKVTAENNSVIIVDGYTDENNVTTPTTIKVNLDDTCNHLKLGENGIYFDGYFGQF